MTATGSPLAAALRRRPAAWALSLALLLLLLCTVFASPPRAVARGRDRYEPNLASLHRHPLPRWWDEGKFGVFIHWGIYAVPAFGAPPTADLVTASVFGPYIPAEWYWRAQQVPGSLQWIHHLESYGTDVVYDDFIAGFSASRFDPDGWIQLFTRAGARYFVLTSKHHDGFALFCSKTTHRDACDLGPRRDLVGELFAAAHRARDRVKPGVYYSVPEWFNPAPYQGGRETWGGGPVMNTFLYPQRSAQNAYTQLPVPYTGYEELDDYAAGQVRPQLRELIDRYHPYVIWCDIGGDEAYFRSNEAIAHYYNRARLTNPGGVVVDDRCGDGRTHHDYDTIEQGAGSAEQPGIERSETARTMGESWGYDREEGSSDYRSVDELVDLLVTSVSENSNLLLNIGPRADGTIPKPMVDRLLGMGEWLRINGEAIYGTRPWRQAAAGKVRFTVEKRTRRRAGAFYMTALEWPGRELVVDAPVPIGRGSRIVLLGSDGRALGYRTDGSKLIVRTPARDPDRATKSKYAFVFRIAPPAR